MLHGLNGTGSSPAALDDIKTIIELLLFAYCTCLTQLRVPVCRSSWATCSQHLGGIPIVPKWLCAAPGVQTNIVEMRHGTSKREIVVGSGRITRVRQNHEIVLCSTQQKRTLITLELLYLVHQLVPVSRKSTVCDYSLSRLAIQPSNYLINKNKF